MSKVFLSTIFLFLSFNGLTSELEERWFAAARNGDIKQIETLLKESPENLNVQDEKGYSALILGSYHEHRDFTLKLMSMGANACLTDRKGNTALMGVIFKGHAEIINDLINKCDVNHQNNEGQTALMYSALFGRERVTQKLLELGARKEIQDHEGRTALSLAAGQWNHVMVSLIKAFHIIKR
ncbi:MAG TPA: ankyrin repeat domain-containing protein [Bacteriovoracaceae bacterium]|nr:ankyrin repeat domain-containing protein [Bacteriovoracaceae bacterium]